MILQVSLRNWRSHGEKNGDYGTVLDFSQGLNVIYGVNGSGKSSVAEAIAYALFGKVSSFKRVLRAGRREGGVRLVFSVGEDIYEVRRVFTLNGTVDSELFRIENGRRRPVALQKSTEVTKEIERLLGVSEELFFRGLYGAQNRITELFEEKGLRRAKLFDEMLGIDELMDVRDRLVRLRNYVDKTLRLVSLGEKERELKEKRAYIEELKSQIEELATEYEDTVKKERVLSEYVESLRERVRSLEEKYRRLVELRERMAKLRGRESAIRSNIKYTDVSDSEEEELKALEDALNTLEGLEKNIAVVEETIKKVEEQLANLPDVAPADLEPLVRKRNELRKKRNELLGELEHARTRLLEEEKLVATLREKLKTIEEARRELEQLRKRREEIGQAILRDLDYITSQLEEVERLIVVKRGELTMSANVELVLTEGDTCPVCGTPLDDEKKRAIVERHKRLREERAREVAELESRLRELKKRKEELKKLEGEMEVLEKRIAELEEKVSGEAEVRQALQKKEGEVKALQRRVSEITEALEELDRKLGEIEEAIEEEQEKAKIYETRKKLSSVKDEKEKELGALKERLDELLLYYRVSSVDEFRRRVEVKRERVESLRLLRELRKVEAELNSLLEEAKTLSGVETEFNGAREELRTKEVELGRLEERARSLANTLTEKRTFLGEEEARLRSLEEEVERIRKLRTALNGLNKLILAWNETIKDVRRARITVINKALRLVWKRVYLSQYGDYDDIEFSVTETTGGNYTYTLRVKTAVGGRTVWRDVEELSGGERTLALISLRIAISYLLSGTARFLILDEPTHNLDENLTRQLAYFLREATGEEGLFDQVILITHDPVFSEAADVVYRLERDKTGDDVTRVTREK